MGAENLGRWLIKFTRDAVLAVVILASLSGCQGEAPQAIVDFSKVKATPRPDTSELPGHALRVAVGAMVSPQETMVYYQQLLLYLGEKTGRNVLLTQKKTYAEVDRLLEGGEIDIAFVCSGPFVTQAVKLETRLLATPEVRGQPYYRSYLIVGVAAAINNLEQLRGKVFAFTDPDSNSGRLVPTFWLAEQGERPESFFRQVVYTHAHDNSIMAVAMGLVDGATVDSLIWDYYQATSPRFTSRTKVIRTSIPFGNPPVVASRHLSAPVAQAVQEALLGMHLDRRGSQILKELKIDRFVAARQEWYDPVRKMQAYLRQTGG